MESNDETCVGRPGRVRLALVVALIPTIAFVLHDLVFQLPDNEGEASIGFYVTIVGLLCVWGCSGFLMARPTNRPGAALLAGAIAGIVSVGILWLTFIVLNNLFLDRMSYEPDRIYAFQQSGYATMREYWDHQRGGGPFPLVMLLAAIVGGIGGAVRRTAQRAAQLRGSVCMVAMAQMPERARPKDDRRQSSNDDEFG